MKRRLFVFCFLGVILVLSLSLVSAGWFGDFWKKINGNVADKNGGLTGGVADETESEETDPSGLDSSADLPTSISSSSNDKDSITAQNEVQTHKVCAGESCITVKRSGIDECTENEQCINQEFNNSCKDTDGGVLFGLYGVVSGYYEGEFYSRGDNCVTPLTLKEMYCDGNTPLSINYNCEFGCAKGACFNGSVNDTTPPILGTFEVESVYQNKKKYLVLRAKAEDDESGIHSRSYTFGGGSLSEDGGSYSCGGEVCVIYAIKENLESGWLDVKVSFLNNAGLSVSDTKQIFIPEDSLNCADTDYGKSYYAYGKVMGVNQDGPFNQEDVCVDGSNILLEYYCDSTILELYSSEIYNCGNDGECINGACVRKNFLTNAGDFFKGIFGRG